jgi:hypothetical protein
MENSYKAFNKYGIVISGRSILNLVTKLIKYYNSNFLIRRNLTVYISLL